MTLAMSKSCFWRMAALWMAASWVASNLNGVAVGLAIGVARIVFIFAMKSGGRSGKLTKKLRLLVKLFDRSVICCRSYVFMCLVKCQSV